MSRLRQAFGVAPRPGVAISGLVALVGALLWAIVAAGFPPALRIALTAAMALFIFLYGFLVSYVYGDAKRRGMRHRIWALVAALVPNGLGFLAYFLLRDPLLQSCGACGAPARRELAFCPQCGSSLRQVCPACRRPLETAWSHCAHCGTKIPGSAVTSAP
jgi:Double zinc ribbon